MDDLRIEDSDGDAFELAETDGGAVLEVGDARVINIAHTDAARMVDWLRERFGLQQELTAIGMDPGLEIAVETETGKSRTVRWYGPDVPGELIRLAEIALVPGGVRAMESLGKVLREVRPVPSESPALLRQLMGTLGCERTDELPTRVQGLVQELDNLAQQIARMAGVEIGPNGANLRALLDKVQEKHLASWENAEKEAARKHVSSCTYRQELQRKINEHHAYRATVPAQIEQAMSTERNARAAVQAELEEVRAEHRKLRRQLADERLTLGHKLEKAREMLRDMRYELCQDDDRETPWSGPAGHVQVDNSVVATWHRNITEALKASAMGI